MYSVEPENAMLFFCKHAWGISASVLIQISPPPWHLSFLNTGLFVCRGKRNTLSCPTSAVSRTLMSKLLHIDSLA